MGTLNPYRAPFLDGNWIIDTANTIGVNHFQLKLISEMFEMFVLLINEINPHSFCFVTCFIFIFTREVLPHRGCSTPSSVLDIWKFAMGICRGNLPQEFAVRICRRYLPWIVLYIYKRILFCIYEQILFIWGQTFSICAQNFLICETFFINSVYKETYTITYIHIPLA